jgi:hypothetical protein
MIKKQSQGLASVKNDEGVWNVLTTSLSERMDWRRMMSVKREEKQSQPRDNGPVYLYGGVPNIETINGRLQRISATPPPGRNSRLNWKRKVRSRHRPLRGTCLGGESIGRHGMLIREGVALPCIVEDGRERQAARYGASQGAH